MTYQVKVYGENPSKNIQHSEQLICPDYTENVVRALQDDGDGDLMTLACTSLERVKDDGRLFFIP